MGEKLLGGLEGDGFFLEWVGFWGEEVVGEVGFFGGDLLHFAISFSFGENLLSSRQRRRNRLMYTPIPTLLPTNTLFLRTFRLLYLLTLTHFHRTTLLLHHYLLLLLVNFPLFR